MDKALFLDGQQAEQIHEATLQVLERTGVSLDHPEVEGLLLADGARKDDDGRLLIPRAMVQAALERACQKITIYDRHGEAAMTLEPGRTYFGPGSDALYQVDRETGEIRDSRLEDVTSNVHLADALGFDFIMSMALPRELPGTLLYPTVFAEMACNTARPMMVTAVTLEDVRHTHALAALLVGGEERLRQRPFFLTYLEPLSPLILDRTAVDKLLFCAERKIPFVFGAGANCGTGAPIRPEGGVVQGGAESLAGLVIAQLRDPDVRFVYGSNTSSADMRSAMVCYGASEWPRTVAMYADLARHYGLPSWGTAGCTDARQVDAQAAWEAYRSILLALQCGSTLVHDMGYMAFGELYDPRMLVLTMEMVREARHLMAPADLSEEALSTVVIDEVCRGEALYLGHQDTARSFRKALFISPLINRHKVGQQHVEMGQRLSQRVDRLLAKHQPDRPDEEVLRQVDAYLKAIPEV